MTRFDLIQERMAPLTIRDEIKSKSTNLKRLDLSERQICDIGQIMNGGFSPLNGFLNEGDYISVVDNMRLLDGQLWPIPVTLDVSHDFSESVAVGESISLCDLEGVVLAILEVETKFVPNKELEALKVFGTTDPTHPAVNYLFNFSGDIYLGGTITGLQFPTYYDFRALRHTPNELRAVFNKLGWSKIVAFQTRNPLHRAHQELTFRAAREANANLLIHPVVGMTKPGDVDHFTRVRCYQSVLSKYPSATTTLSLLDIAMRMAGPREALWHALIRKNYGCTHFIVGRDHAGPGLDSKGNPFYGPYEAQELMSRHEVEIGIEALKFRNMAYVKERAQYEVIDEIEDDENVTVLELSGTELRRRLSLGLDIPNWFSFPEVVRELRKSYPPLEEQGIVIFFTGLSGAGKSTIANALQIKLMEIGARPVTLLDGDIVRKHLSSELGFSKEHRDVNVRRIGYVASEICKNRGIAICAPIAPYEKSRADVRNMVEAYGTFMEIFVSTSLEVCESRDRKGLYKLAREGVLSEFTGISDPYETPVNPDLIINTENRTVDDCVQEILLKLEKLCFFGIEK